jgi:hypothetical protein
MIIRINSGYGLTSFLLFYRVSRESAEERFDATVKNEKKKLNRWRSL